MRVIEIMTERKVPYGERTIEVRLRFWTNDIASMEGHVVPKHCWDSGFAILVENEGHGLEPGKRAFRSIAGIGSAVEALLEKGGVTVHHGRTAHLYK